MHPSHQCKANGFGRKITLDFGEDLFFFGDYLILGRKNVRISDFGRKNTLNFGEDLFFFFFGDHLNLGRKNVRISDFGPKITLNFSEDIRSFEGLCLKSPPPKFSRSATVCWISELHYNEYTKAVGLAPRHLAFKTKLFILCSIAEARVLYRSSGSFG